MTCSASYAVTMVVLFLFNSISLCFGCTSDKHGEAINILKCFAEPGLSHSFSRSIFKVTTSSLKRRFDFSLLHREFSTGRCLLIFLNISIHLYIYILQRRWHLWERADNIWGTITVELICLMLSFLFNLSNAQFPFMSCNFLSPLLLVRFPSKCMPVHTRWNSQFITQIYLHCGLINMAYFLTASVTLSKPPRFSNASRRK